MCKIFRMITTFHIHKLCDQIGIAQTNIQPLRLREIELSATQTTSIILKFPLRKFSDDFWRFKMLLKIFCNLREKRTKLFQTQHSLIEKLHFLGVVEHFICVAVGKIILSTTIETIFFGCFWFWFLRTTAHQSSKQQQQKNHIRTFHLFWICC